MKKISVFILCFVAINFVFAQSQLQTVYRIEAGCYVAGMHFQSSQQVLTGYSRHGNDSSWFNMIWLNDSDQVISHKEFKASRKYNFMWHSVPFANGFLLSGSFNDATGTFTTLIKTDMQGT